MRAAQEQILPVCERNDRRLVALCVLNACLDARIVNTAVRLSMQLARHRTAPEHREHAHTLPSTCPQLQTWLGRSLHRRVRSGELTKLHFTHRNACTNALIGIRPLRRVSGRYFHTLAIRCTKPIAMRNVQAAVPDNSGGAEEAVAHPAADATLSTPSFLMPMKVRSLALCCHAHQHDVGQPLLCQ